MATMPEAVVSVTIQPPNLAVYDPVRAAVAELKTLNASLVFQYETPKGNRDARSHVYVLRQKKGDVERIRKDAKADALEYGRKVDQAAKELTAELDAMIDVHWKPLEEIENRERLSREAKDRAEAEAKAKAEAEERARQEALLAVERAEVERLKAEAAERDRKDREERLQREAAETARREAEERAAREKAELERREREAQDAKIAAERAAIEAEKRAIQEAKDAAEKAERDKAAAVAAERERIEAERIAKERAEAERARQAGVREALIREIASAIERTVVIGDSDAVTLATAILDGKIARVRAITEEAA